MSTFGSRLFQARDEAGVSQEEVGQIMRVTRQQVGYWEAGLQNAPRRLKRLAQFQKLADRLGVRIEWLLDDKQPMRRPGDSAPAKVARGTEPNGELLGAEGRHALELKQIERDLTALLWRIQDLRKD